MPESIFPTTIAGFTEHIKIAYGKAQANLTAYGIAPEKLAAITPRYNAYVAAEALAADPDTATKGNRRAREDARKLLQPAWRRFLNENIRYNSAVPAADLEVFGIRKRDTARTPAGVPGIAPVLSIRQAGVRRYEIDVLNSETGKKKKPPHAAGSFVYMAVTAPGEEPHHEGEFRKLSFSSNYRHVVDFPLEQLAKQANFCARYANAHGKEGPESATEAVIIG
jgi:hypothetical protein